MNPEIAELYARIGKLEGTLEAIRDLARTGNPPMAYNMTAEEWKTHKLNQIASAANRALEESNNED